MATFATNNFGISEITFDQSTHANFYQNNPICAIAYRLDNVDRIDIRYNIANFIKNLIVDGYFRELRAFRLNLNNRNREANPDFKDIRYILDTMDDHISHWNMKWEMDFSKKGMLRSSNAARLFLLDVEKSGIEFVRAYNLLKNEKYITLVTDEDTIIMWIIVGDKAYRKSTYTSTVWDYDTAITRYFDTEGKVTGRIFHTINC